MRKPIRRVQTLTKMVAKDGALLCYTMGAQRRIGRHDTEFIRLEDVPPFEGNSADFEMERVQGTPWARWVAIRRVDG
jgi:hypothetical protein